ncbi:hypothetical protein TE101_11495 [Alteromonas macleodii]|nr:hypothetical protein TE101_11495 [Alteromonas macleodii]
MKGQGLERVHLFVKKLIGLQESKIFPTIKKIIKLRNSCAHNDAKICEKDGQPIRAIAEMIEDEKINVSQDGKHVHIEDGFLIFVLSQFDAYTSEIKETIEAK